MMYNKKYYNDAFVGNDNVTASYSKYGELIRLYYPKPDYRQFIEFFHTGIKVNDSNIIYLHYDVNNSYNQYYTEDTNILNTQIENSYFHLKIKQIDFVAIDKDVIIKKYVFTNENDIDLNLNFLVHSKVVTNANNMASGMIVNNSLVQYTHNSEFIVTSDRPLLSHQINNVDKTIDSGRIWDKDYVGMSQDSAVSFELGTLGPGESAEFNLYLFIKYEDVDMNIISDVIDEIKEIKPDEELLNTENFWRKYVEDHDTLKLHPDGTEITSKTIDIYRRTILFAPLLFEETTGGIAATLEVDEATDQCGRYSYCWPRDGIMIYSYLDHLNFDDYSALFYDKFLKNTQTKAGFWEQRYYTDGKLAPCWGYQIDETALVVWGALKHYQNVEKRTGKRDYDFLKRNLDMIEKATKFLEKYICFNLNDEDLLAKVNQEFEDTYNYKDVDEVYKHTSYDLWEECEGVHLFSLCSIHAAFDAMIKIFKLLIDDGYLKDHSRYDELIKRYGEYKARIKQYILDNLVDKQKSILVRNTQDRKTDISIMGAVIPFKVFEPDDPIIKNTVDQINFTIRTYASGYLRYQGDNYVGGKYPWVIATAWMGMYYKYIGAQQEYENCLKFVVNSATLTGLLPEQCSNEFNERWVLGLGWSHAMFIGLLLDQD